MHGTSLYRTKAISALPVYIWATQSRHQETVLSAVILDPLHREPDLLQKGIATNLLQLESPRCRHIVFSRAFEREYKIHQVFHVLVIIFFGVFVFRSSQRMGLGANGGRRCNVDL